MDGGVEGGLRAEGWVVGEVGAGERKALVHGIVEALGGSVRVRSKGKEKGRGTGEVLHEEFAHRLREADVDAWVGGFREDAHVGRALELGSWIWLGYTHSFIKSANCFGPYHAERNIESCLWDSRTSNLSRTPLRFSPKRIIRSYKSHFSVVAYPVAFTRISLS